MIIDEQPKSWTVAFELLESAVKAKKVCFSKKKSHKGVPSWWSFFLTTDLLNGTENRERFIESEMLELFRSCEFNCSKVHQHLKFRLSEFRRNNIDNPALLVWNCHLHAENLLRRVCELLATMPAVKPGNPYFGTSEWIYYGGVKHVNFDDRTSFDPLPFPLGDGLCICCHRVRPEKNHYCNYHGSKFTKSKKGRSAHNELQKRLHWMNIALIMHSPDEGLSNPEDSTDRDELPISSRAARVRNIVKTHTDYLYLQANINQEILNFKGHSNFIQWSSELIPLFQNIEFQLTQYHRGEYSLFDGQIAKLSSGEQLRGYLFKHLGLDSAVLEIEPPAKLTPKEIIYMIDKASFFLFLEKMVKQKH